MTTNTSQFDQILINNAAGTQTEISQWVTASDPQRSATATDVSTFAQGGGPVTKTYIRGAYASEFTVKGLFDPTYAKIMRQVIAIRAGTAFLQRAGTNNIPGQSDEDFSATMCPISYTISYKFGSPASIDTDLKLADGASIPTFGAI